MRDSSEQKLIVTAAITGSRITREQTPYIPITPEEISESAVSSWRAGAAIVHIHVRDPETGLGTQDPAIFADVIGRIRKESDVVLNLTTSGIPGRNFPDEVRIAGLQFGPELASLDAGSMNLGGGVFICSPETLEFLARSMKERSVKPELEIFEFGMIRNCLILRDRGLLDTPLHFQFVLGAAGGSPADPRILMLMLDMIPRDSTWSVAGIGRGQLPMGTMAMMLGGHVRVGLEDSIYYSRGVPARSNAEMVERAVRIAREYGREVATPDEAREILGLRQQPADKN